MLIRGNSASIGSSCLSVSEVLLSPCLDVEWCCLFPSPCAAWNFYSFTVFSFLFCFFFAGWPDDRFAKRLFTRVCRALKSCQKVHLHKCLNQTSKLMRPKNEDVSSINLPQPPLLQQLVPSRPLHHVLSGQRF